MSSEQDLPVTPCIPPPPPLEATYPINDFFTQGPVAAGLLALSAAAALILANSPWSHIYGDFLHAIISFEAGPFGISQSVRHWINDGLMCMFFFLGVTWPQLFGVACLGGIGFTVSLFINGLAFAGNEEMLAAGKLGIFLASFIASLAGLLSLWYFTRGTPAAKTGAD